jgi:hypothetical protein
MRHFLFILCLVSLCAGSFIDVDAQNNGVKRGVSIEGILRTSVAGIPLANYEVAIYMGSFSGPEFDERGKLKGSVPIAVTDSTGRFRLTIIPVQNNYPDPYFIYARKPGDRYGQWLNDNVISMGISGRRLEFKVKSDQTAVYSGCCWTKVGDYLKDTPLLRVGAERSTNYSLGEILVSLDAEVNDVKKYCEMDKPVSSTESYRNNLIALARNKETPDKWGHLFFDAPEFLQSFSPKSQYMMCIVTSSSLAGTYGNTMLTGTDRFYDVRLIRLADAKEWKEMFVESAPRTFGGQVTTWREKVLKWLEEVTRSK